ncbi:MAG: DUF2007 domain-containing protein [Pseudomonadota bacterium]
MKLLYQAAHSVEAHMIVNLLEQQGVAARIDGEYLQGGIGDLPAFGLVRVMVAEDDFAQAQAIVTQWDAQQPASMEAPAPLAPTTARARAGVFAAGLVIGLLCAVAWYRAPLHQQGIDRDHNGVFESKAMFAAEGAPLRTELDRNRDGKIDLIVRYDAMGGIDSNEADDDFDGVFESVTSYRQGNPYLGEADTDGDGLVDLKTHYENGVVVSVEHVNPATGQVQKVDFYTLGKITHSLVDSNQDGTMDRRIGYTGVGNVRSVDLL